MGKTFAVVATEHTVYVVIATRAEFDKIARPMTDLSITLGKPVLTKSVEQKGVTVIFQYWLN